MSRRTRHVPLWTTTALVPLALLGCRVTPTSSDEPTAPPTELPFEEPENLPDSYMCGLWDGAPNPTCFDLSWACDPNGCRDGGGRLFYPRLDRQDSGLADTVDYWRVSLSGRSNDLLECDGCGGLPEDFALRVDAELAGEDIASVEDVTASCLGCAGEGTYITGTVDSAEVVVNMTLTTASESTVAGRGFARLADFDNPNQLINIEWTFRAERSDDQ